MTIVDVTCPACKGDGTGFNEKANRWDDCLYCEGVGTKRAVDAKGRTIMEVKNDILKTDLLVTNYVSNNKKRNAKTHN